MATGTIQKDMVLLWENPNPSSSYSGGTIPLDLTSYDLICLAMSEYTTTSTRKYYFFAKVGEVAPCAWAGSPNGFGVRRRLTTINSDSVVFDHGQVLIFGQSAYQTEDTTTIPYRIYGLKE